ncbi:MAG: hypothetical protein ACFE95_14370 [Candidatus Hodarchaeota archaeon]
MSYSVEELYRLEKKDIKNACLVLGKAFQDDPAWIHLVPDENERK